MADAAAPVASRPRESRPHRMGWRIVARKEFTDQIMSWRFTILVMFVGLASIAVVYAAYSGARSGAESTSEIPAVFIKLYTAVASPSPISFVGLVGLLSPLLGIAFGFDSVSSERAQGTLPRLLSQPIHRDDVINGKFAAGLATIALVLGILTSMVAAVGVFRLGIVPSPAEIGRMLAYYVVVLIYAGFWLALSTLFSVALKQAAVSAIAAIAAWLVLAIFGGLVVNIIADATKPPPDQIQSLDDYRQAVANARLKQNLSRFSPTSLYVESTIVLLNPDVNTLDQEKFLLQQIDVGQRALPSKLSLDQSLLIVWPQIIALVVLTAACFAGAYISFMRQEVRA